jgi:5'-phosphate synthase pdxT subunit
MKRIGILALQGGFAAHEEPLRKLGHVPCLVREAGDLRSVDGLVLPGGESSVHLALIERFGLRAALLDFARAGKPILATCAGLILAAHGVTSPAQGSLDILDIDVVRNAYGRQRHSFEATDDGGTLPLVFIRAPRITRTGHGVDVLATFAGQPVLVREGNVLGGTFHPELTSETTVHRLAFGAAA